MKTSNKINIVFKLIASLFLVCWFIIQTFRIYSFYGEGYFSAVTIVYSLGIVLGIAALIMYLLLFRKYKIQYGILYLFIIIVLLPFLIYGSINYYKDLFNGKVVFETEIYRTPVESYYEAFLDMPKEIELSDYMHAGCLNLKLSDEMYYDLIRNNPYDTTRKVHNAHFDETTYPHIHHIIIKFYENTEIVDSIQIVYDENGL